MKTWIGSLEPRRLWFFPPVMLGALVLATSVLLAPGAPRHTEGPPPLSVRAMEVTRTTVQPHIVGYGTVRPARLWQAVAQVPGSLIFRSPAAEPGAVIPAGTRVLEIDPRDYTLAVTRAKAQLEASRAALEELVVRKRDLDTSLAIERESLGLSEKDFERKRQLASEGHISATELDAERQRLLRQRQTVQTLEAQRHSLPMQIASLEARIDESRAGAEKAEQDIERTRFNMPFEGRITEVGVDVGQFVPSGQRLLVAEALDRMEVMVELPLDALVSRFPDLAVANNPEQLERIGLTAEVSYTGSDLSLHWPGKVTRVDVGLNPRTRAARLYVEVEQLDSDYQLQANLYVRVDIVGPALEDKVAIPRLAYHDGVVYLAGAESRLIVQPVEVAFRDSTRVVLESGLEAGDVLILTDIPYPVTGTPVSVTVATTEGLR